MPKEFFQELKDIILSKDLSNEEIIEKLENYHDSDVADALEGVSKEDRLKIYSIIGIERTAEIFAFYDDVEVYIEELSPELAADVLEKMDADEALEVLNELEDEDKTEIIGLMEDESKEAVQLIDAYDESMIGSYMTNNFISIKTGLTIKQAMNAMVNEAGEHDNIYRIYVVDEKNIYRGAIDLKDLITARKDDSLEDLIMESYPSFYDDELMSECIVKLRDYNESSIPILNHKNEILGVITNDILLDATEEEFEEDYSKLAGLSDAEELNESVFASIKKRIPWLVILLFLGLFVSTVVGAFEAVIAALPVMVFFQSMILDMSGNAGTQSLAVTIRNITSEELDDKGKTRKNIFKEILVGFLDGVLVGCVAFLFVLIYLAIRKPDIVSDGGYTFTNSLRVASIIGSSMIVAMTIAGLMGATIPLILKKLRIDPAVASGPFITTINDIIAVSIYYGLTYLLFIIFL